jgi:hypothetical protein
MTASFTIGAIMKLKLDLNALAVDSFDTTRVESPAGTVFGEEQECTCLTACTGPGCLTCGETCADSCNGTCFPDCPRETKYETCLYTCGTNSYCADCMV